ncbi:AAA family ATPase [Acinetobacter pittii]|uniref:AAA family ATPase n=1 Tax=Acinetobacter pittii TaxID=48296 RepID=UPI00083E179A|nr:AAA family ATPase [Acinetobacter pittii]MCU4430808.1 AAA family ATPase [Acinetobacter pittii]MCU4532573.1 AAA family ATPase [Acinetobacter pittii]ODI96272.1 recombinase RecF [Acinetobacter pittii]
MKIQNLEINGVGGITHLNLNFDNQMNIICGPNGIGKTTILESIAHCFTQQRTNILKKNAKLKNAGIIKANLSADDQVHPIEINIDNFVPEKESYIHGRHDFAKSLISLKVNRNFSYQKIDAIVRDPDFDLYNLSTKAKNGTDNHDIKSWFIHRHLYSAHSNALSEEQLYNFNLATECFSILNKNFIFSRVKPDTNDIMLHTPNGEVYFEYLSSGFKSTISIIFGIIKEIEHRFKDPHIKADLFDGIILVDELELHLHPEWQAKIVDALTVIFPLAQFFVSTHSPHILQNAQANQIIALSQNEELIVQRDLTEFIYGFQGWTVEEILTDVMGMSDTRTDLYQKTLSDFNNAIEDENIELAIQNFKKLNNLLHPTNHLKKLLKLELASIGGEI